MARYVQEEGYPSLRFLLWITSAEIIVFIACVLVLGIAFLMFMRLFDALSPPTKALAWVVGADELLALLLLAFMCFQMHYYARAEFIPQGTYFCHYANPLVLALVVFGWLGQPVIAWTTLKTLRNEPVPSRRLRRIFYWCMAVALLDYVWGVVVTPGKIVNGSFCIMKAKHPGQIDARIFANLIGLVTFVVSLVLYCKSYRHLKRLQRKMAKDLRKLRPGDASASEPKEAEASSLQPGSHVSHGSMSGEAEASGGSVGPVEVVVVDKGGHRWGEEISDDEDSSVDSEEDAPFTYAQLQARTQAARAAVNLLLPHRTDDMAGRDGPYGAHRRARERKPLEDGVDLSALLELQPQHQPSAGRHNKPTPPSSSGGDRGGGSGSGSGGQQRSSSQQTAQQRSRASEENAPAEVDRLCVQANRALVGRACTLMVVYYLPTFILYGWLAYYGFAKPPPSVVPFMGVVFFLGTPVLQTCALLQLAVSIGGNVLQFYRQYLNEDGAEEEEEIYEEEAEAAEGEGAAPSPLLKAPVGDAAAVAFYVVPGEQQEAPAATGVAPPPLAPVASPGFLYEQGRRPSAPAAEGSPVSPKSPETQAGPQRPGGTAVRRRTRRGGKAGGGKAGGAPMQQALATIYEVAFRTRGRDAAASMRHVTTAAAAAKHSAAAGSGGGSGEGSSSGEGGPAGGESDELAQAEGGGPSSSEGDAGAGSGSGGDVAVADSSDEGAATLRQNALVQEMLGVNATRRAPFPSPATASPNDGAAEGPGGAAGADRDLVASRFASSEPSPAGYGYGGGGVAVVDRWQAESELSSLTDAQDYQSQFGSLASSPNRPNRSSVRGSMSLGPTPAASARASPFASPFGSPLFRRRQQPPPAQLQQPQSSPRQSLSSPRLGQAQQLQQPQPSPRQSLVSPRQSLGSPRLGQAQQQQEAAQQQEEQQQQEPKERMEELGRGDSGNPSSGASTASQQQQDQQGQQQEQQQQQGTEGGPAARLSLMSPPRMSDAGRSIVTESEWRAWKEGEGQKRK